MYTYNIFYQALYYKKYSTASDVWSYGALMYEIWSVGHKPYETYENNKVINNLVIGSMACVSCCNSW